MSTWTEFALTALIALSAAGISLTLTPRLSLARAAVPPRLLGTRSGSDRLVLVLGMAYVLVFGTLSLLRHASLHSGGYDLGIFDQVVWNSLQGRPFENSLMVDSPLFLGHHFAPLLMAIVPLYAVWSDARVLLILQTIALAAAAVPLYWFARRRLGPGLACAVAGAFFLFPALQGVNLFEFHEISLATPLLAFALYFLLLERYPPFLVCLGLAMLSKEEVGLIAIAFGLYILFIQRRRALGLALALFGVAWSAALLVYVIPYFYGTASGTGFYYAYRYSYLGSDVPHIVASAISKPGLVLQHLLVPDKLEFVLQLLVPLAFVPLIGTEVLALAIPSLGYLLISDYPYQYSIRYQYSAPLVPIIFFSLVVGLARLSNRRLAPASADTRVLSNRHVILAVLLLAASLANYFFQSTGPLARHFEPEEYALSTHVRIGYQLLDAIPSDAAVMVETNLAPHISERRYIYEPSLVPDLRQIDYIIADTTVRQHYEEHAKMIWDVVLGLPFFETEIEQDGYIVKKRASPLVANPLRIQFDDRITLLGYTAGSTTPALRGASLPIVLVWHADRSVTDRFVVFVHLLDAQGHLWQQDNGEPGRGWFRTDRWKTGDVTKDGYTLGLPSIMPPGDYRITVRLCTVESDQCLDAHDEAGNPLGSEPALGTLPVGKEISPGPIEPVSITHPLEMNMGDLRLMGYTPEFSSTAPGDHLDLGLYWRAERKPGADLQVVLQLRDQNGKVVFEQIARPANNDYPTTQWQAGEVLLDWRDLTLPATLAAGDYQMSVALQDTSGRAIGPNAVLGVLQVAAVPRRFTVPPIAHTLETNFNNEIKLLGYDLATKQGKVQLTLYWQALKPMLKSYTVFTHLLDEQGQIAAQQDNLPAAGERPTTGWLPGEIVTDVYTLALASDKRVGTFQVEVGLYEATSGVRLASLDGKDHIILTSVEVK